MPATKIIWFRNNLRLNDNEALAKACASTDFLIPVYIINNDWFKTGYYGIQRMGVFRFSFLLESLRELRKNLKKQKSELVVKTGRPVDQLVMLCKTHQVKKVYFQRIYAHDEMKEEEELSRRLLAMGIDCEGVEDDTLMHKEDLPFPISHLPEPFTKFRKWVEADWMIRNLINAPQKLPPFPDNITLEPIPNVNDFFSTKTSTVFKGGEVNAWDRLNHYIWESDNLKHYKETRNGLLGLDYSSKLSPWLSLGCISPRQIYAEIVRYESQRVKNESTYWLVLELLWRDYFKWLSLKFNQKIFLKEGTHGAQVYKNNALDERIFNQWIDGKTGKAFVDANMIELQQTGFMSNRGRQIVASYLINDLKQPWLAGAAYFEKMLIDFDPASNYGNWAYIAGVGVDPRKNRYFNIEKQAQTYDPEGKYVQKWLNR